MDEYKLIFEQENKEVSVPAGTTIHHAAAKAGVILSAVCGGLGTCGKCVVKILPDGTDVLACQYKVNKDITVTVPFADRLFEQRKIAQQTKLDIPVDSAIAKQYLKDNPSDTAAAIFGAAVDIGTTTVVLKLFNLTDGTPLSIAASANPQISRGDDVISRINYASTDEGLEDMHKVIIGCLNSLIDNVCHHSKVDKNDIYEITIAGNTTMNHLFLKLPVKQLGQSPYEAHSLDAFDLNASDMGLKVNPAANVHTVENIAGFVGADTTAAALAINMDTIDKMSLLVDIGTNGELVLGTKDKLYAASCAAGPALEGARIEQGSRAVAGAIEGVEVGPEDILIEVIGDEPAKSICGSGLIDTVAVMLDLGIIDQTGRLLTVDDLAGKLPEKIQARLTTKNNEPAFILADNEDNDNDPVIFTQKDVRETQLAKAAIRAGIMFLQKKIGVTDAQLDQVLLAGAFGNYIDRHSAVRIGLLPAVEVEKVHFVGNAAATGSQMVLLNNDCRQRAQNLARSIEYVEIANELEFQMVFAEALMFD